MDKPKLQLYGTDWCPKSSALRNYMQSKWLEFDDFNVELDDEANGRIRSLFEGKLKFPVVMIGGEFIKNPSVGQLNEFLRKHYVQ